MKNILPALRAPKVLIVGVALGLSLLLIALTGADGSIKQRPENPYQAQSTRLMAERLREAGRRLGSSGFAPLVDARLSRRFKEVKDPPDLKSRLIKQARSGHESLIAGSSRTAAEQFLEVKNLLLQNPDLFEKDFLDFVSEMLAISYLRIGEQENCLNHHGSDSCLFPIRGSGIHQAKEGARLAIKEYHDILRRNPDDLSSRWLLNIACMAIGDYPRNVPKEWLIPPTVFKSDYDIKRFTDIAPLLGVDVNALAGGGIVEDFDGDGYLDIVASSLSYNEVRDQLRFFRNNADGSFTDRTKEAGLTGIVGGLNICSTDYNNDGLIDIFVPRGAWLGPNGHHPHSLLRNNGDGTFDEVAEQAGLLSMRPSQTAIWGDYDNDGWLDLFIGAESLKAGIFSDKNPCQLFRNNRDGTFTDVAGQVGLAVVGWVKGAAWGDYDNDGLPDLYISRLYEPNLLFHNNGGDSKGIWSFSDVTEKAGVKEPVDSFPTWFWDYDNDGWLDIFVSGYSYAPANGGRSASQVAADYLGLKFEAETPRLYRNNADGSFTDVTGRVKLKKVLYTMGSNFGDLDNDGFLDFYLGTGDPDYRSLMPNRMFRNAGGRFFQDVTTSGGFGHLQKGHGVSFGDIDNDGDQDVYSVIGGAYFGDVYPNVLFENPGHGNRWITLKLEGTQSNRIALGTRLKISVNTGNGVRHIYNTVTTGGSFGNSSLQQEIGLGRATSIRSIEVLWPATGKTQVFKNIGMNQIVKIREGDPVAKPVALKRLNLSPAARQAKPEKPQVHHGRS